MSILRSRVRYKWPGTTICLIMSGTNAFPNTNKFYSNIFKFTATPVEIWTGSHFENGLADDQSHESGAHLNKMLLPDHL